MLKKVSSDEESLGGFIVDDDDEDEDWNIYMYKSICYWGGW